VSRALGAGDIALLVDELAPLWEGAQVQKIYMKGPSVVLLVLRAPGRSGVLRLSVEPGAGTLFVSEDRGPVDDEPSSFCMLLRRLLKGRRIESLEQLGGDRVVRVRGPGGSLVAEMIGRRGRLVALEPTGAVITTSSPGRAGPRPGLERGGAYEPPSLPAGGVSPGEPTLEAGRANDQARALVDVVGDEADELRRALCRSLSAEAKKVRRAESKVQADLDRAGDAESFARYGELLKISMGRVRRGMSSFSAPDVLSGTGELVEIPLDPTLDAKGNLERLFKKARKARRTVTAASERLEALATERKRLEGLVEWAGEADRDELEALAAERGLTLDPRRPGRRRELPRKPYREHRDGRGRPIYVGRSAGDNDTLTTKVARPTDLWLHARGTVGSHVVVPLGKDEEIDQEQLLDAATLAAHFSSARNDERVEIAYTRRRYVRKPKGAPPGLVTLLREKVMLLVMEPTRLDRLLRSAGPSSKQQVDRGPSRE